jgi:hypothetical protein
MERNSKNFNKGVNMEKGIGEILVKVQSELKVPKKQRNNFGNYNYRSCEDILEAVKPLLLKHGAYLVITDELIFIGNRYYIKAKCLLSDNVGSIEAFGYAREEESKKGMDSAQITGSVSSYARKYALNGLFAIDDTKDSDAINKHDKETSSEPILRHVEPQKPIVDVTPQQSKPKNGEMLINDVIVTKVEEKSGENNGKAWTRYDIHFDMQDEMTNMVKSIIFATFDKKLGEIAKNAVYKHGYSVYYIQDGKFKTLTNILPF